MKNMTADRIAWIDNLKAYGIFLVVLAHHEKEIPDYLLKYIYSFHVPLFFFASGLSFNPEKYENLKAVLVDKFRSLLIPYIVFSFSTYLFWLILHMARGQITFGSAEMIKPFIGIFYSSNWIWMTHNPPLWFLTCLFVVELEFYLIYKYSKRIRLDQLVVLGMLLLLSLLGCSVSRHIPFRLPWGMDISITALSLFGTAFYIKPKLHVYLNKRDPRTFLMLAPLLISLLVFSIHFSYTGDFVNMGLYRIHDCFNFLIAAIAGVLCCCILSAMTPHNRILSFVGSNTIIILAFHLPAWSLIRGFQIASSWVQWDVVQNSLVMNMIYSVTQIALVVPVIILIRRYVPCLIRRTVPK